MRRIFDPRDYLARIGFEGAARADLDMLRRIHALHPVAIPFENLSTLLGHPVPLDVESLEAKLVHAGRGGYCFEHNRLFAAALEAVGFELTCLAARVTWFREPGEPGPRTHMVLLVDVGTERYLCDVGFGGLTLETPLAFEPDLEQSGRHERFRLARCARDEYELSVELETGWQSMYRFDLQPQRSIDYEVLNHFVATHPSSPFLSQLMAARRTAAGRYALTDGRLSRYEGNRIADRRELGSVGELRETLAGLFEITLPDDAGLDARLAHALAATS